jgi:hypothetical protein
VLTLGPHVIVNVNTDNYVYLGSAGSNHAGDGIVNQGTINVQGSALYIDSYNFTNQGIINVSAGTLNIEAGSTFLNSGALTANGGNIVISTTEAAGGTGGTATIYGTSQIEYSAASYDNVTFAPGSTGELLLLNSGSFHGTVTGFTGAGTGTPATSDKIDLRDINFSSSITKSYANNILTVSDGSHTANIQMAGAYTLANFHFATDGSGGTLVTDPPASFDQDGTSDNTTGVAAHSTTTITLPGVGATSQSLGPVVMHDPGLAVTPVTMLDPAPAQSTIVATAPDQTLSGFGASDTFVFNFVGVGHTVLTDFHPLSDVLQFDESVFANARAVLKALHDDGHGNTVITIDGHDSITLTGVPKAQMHTADFHIV